MRSKKDLVVLLFPNTFYKRHIKKIEKKYNKDKVDIEGYTKRRYENRFGVSLNTIEPNTFYEKINFLKLFYAEPNPEILIDKVLVKDYLIDLGYQDNVAKKIASFYHFSEFKRFIKETSEKQFVVKLNQTSGDVFFYNHGVWREKHGYRVTKHFVFSCLKNMISLNYYHVSFEKVYENIVPQILIEEYIPSINNSGLDEYKLFCNYGEVKLINVVKGRQAGGIVNEAFTDLNLNKYDVHQDQKSLEQNEIIVPKCFDLMKEFCKKTVSDRPFVRVDLMAKDDSFIFCEFTFYDCGGMNIFYPIEQNSVLGSLIDIDKIISDVNNTRGDK